MLAQLNLKGNTAQSLCGRNADIFFFRLHRIFESILSYDEKIMCKITENLQVYGVQSPLTCFVRCCLKNLCKELTSDRQERKSQAYRRMIRFSGTVFRCQDKQKNSGVSWSSNTMERENI